MTGQLSIRSFLIRAGLICVAGVLIMGVFTMCLVWAAESSAPAAQTGLAPPSYNAVGSFGMVGYQALAVTPTDETPSFIANPLKEKRGVILLIYIRDSIDDEEMVDNFSYVKSKYAADASFFAFEARNVSELGDVPSQLKVDQPPALAVISGDGKVYQLYTGWIDVKVMEQVVANALRR